METIKEEKKAEGNEIISVGQLMKSLIERGWLPRGDKEIVRAVYDVRHKMIGLYEDDGKKYFELVYKKSLRELVSTDSGLWQFVCENELVKPVVDIISICSYSHFTDDHEDCGWDETFPEYRLIESALRDESELEDFLLNSIKLD